MALIENAQESENVPCILSRTLISRVMIKIITISPFYGYMNEYECSQ